MLGSEGEAEDALQESWLKLSRADNREVVNFGGWLTTIVSRVCLDMLRARKTRREDYVGLEVPEPDAGTDARNPDPEGDAVLADSMGPALVAVMEMLNPPERVAFVLHDIFDLPFDEIGPILGRSTAATRQLASRARRRLQSAPRKPAPEREEERKIVEAFLAATREGNFEKLLALLSPDAEIRVDDFAVRLGADGGSSSNTAIVERFIQRGRGLELVQANGIAALGAYVGGELRIVFSFSIEKRTIVAIDMIADPDRLSGMEIVRLQD